MAEDHFPTVRRAGRRDTGSASATWTDPVTPSTRPSGSRRIGVGTPLVWPTRSPSYYCSYLGSSCWVSSSPLHICGGEPGRIGLSRRAKRGSQRPTPVPLIPERATDRADVATPPFELFRTV